jgi:hypothetical protein
MRPRTIVAIITAPITLPVLLLASAIGFPTFALIYLAMCFEKDKWVSWREFKEETFPSC